LIVPLICAPWIVQWYAYEPKLLNVNENESPGAMKPESKTPVFEVAVCVTWPLFVQQTVVPTGTLTFAGSKKLSPIDTSADPAGQPGGGPASCSVSTLESEVVAPSRPPAATSVLPIAAVPANDRCAFNGGCGLHVFEPESKLTTSVVVNGANGFPPPIENSSPCATAPPDTFFGLGRLCRCDQLFAAMS